LGDADLGAAALGAAALLVDDGARSAAIDEVAAFFFRAFVDTTASSPETSWTAVLSLTPTAVFWVDGAAALAFGFEGMGKPWLAWLLFR
jgi:hypothetical protein